MHIIIGILTLLGGLAAWYYRLKMIGTAAKDVTRLAQRVRNAPRKFTFMRRVGSVGLKAVNDPREAAAILMVLIAGGYGERPLKDAAVKTIKREIAGAFELNSEEAGQFITHAVWMLRDVEAPSGVAARMAQVIIRAPAIGAKEVVDLDTMLIAVSEADGLPDEDTLRLLQIYRDRAGLQA